MNDKRTTEMCGGCGNYDPAQRCIGCLHEFTPAAKPVPEHISDERLAEVRRLASVEENDCLRDGARSAAQYHADVGSALTELQHRREGAVAQADVRDPIMLIADELVVIAANCASRNDGRAVRDVSRKLYALAASPSSSASGVRVKALRWVPYNDGVRAKSILRGIYAVLHDGDDPDEWSARYDGRVLGYHRSQSDGEAACQSHFDAAIRSALGEHP